jgi:hypothetical protein
MTTADIIHPGRIFSPDKTAKFNKALKINMFEALNSAKC